jgi:hypothetical protein
MSDTSNEPKPDVQATPASERPANVIPILSAPPSYGRAEGFGDVTAHFNARDWLQSAIEAKGAVVTGAGMGMGQADISFKLDGCNFSVSIRPL